MSLKILVQILLFGQHFVTQISFARINFDVFVAKGRKSFFRFFSFGRLGFRQKAWGVAEGQTWWRHSNPVLTPSLSPHLPFSPRLINGDCRDTVSLARNTNTELITEHAILDIIIKGDGSSRDAERQRNCQN